MPQPCTICGHPERRMLNFLLAAKQPLRRVARQYGVSKSALSRHWAQHRQAASAEAMDMARTMTALNSQLEDLLQEVRQARGRAPAASAPATGSRYSLPAGPLPCPTSPRFAEVDIHEPLTPVRGPYTPTWLPVRLERAFLHRLHRATPARATTPSQSLEAS